MGSECVYDASDVTLEVASALFDEMERPTSRGVIATTHITGDGTLVVVTNGGQSWAARFTELTEEDE